MFKLKHKKGEMFLEVFLPDGKTLVTDRFEKKPIYSLKEYERAFKILFGTYFMKYDMGLETFKELWQARTDESWTLQHRMTNDFIQDAMETFSKMEVFSYLPSKPKLKQDWRYFKFTNKGLEFSAYLPTDVIFKYVNVQSSTLKNIGLYYDIVMKLQEELNTLTDYGLTPQTFLYYFCGKDITKD
jgi:hypothetical protein